MKHFNNNENNSLQFAQISQKSSIIDFNRVLNMLLDTSKRKLH